MTSTDERSKSRCSGGELLEAHQEARAVERLLEIVVCAEGESELVVVDQADDDDRYAGGAGIGLELLQHLPAVAAGQDEVEGDRHGALGERDFDDLVAFAGPDHAIARRLEVARQAAEEDVVVLGHQHRVAGLEESLAGLGAGEVERQRLAGLPAVRGGGGVDRQDDAEEAAVAGFRLDLDPSAVHLGEALDQRQAEAGAAHVARAAAVHLPELLEDQLLIVAADADAAVDHLDEEGRGRRDRTRRTRRRARAAGRRPRRART